jgi:hypothetical protein
VTAVNLESLIVDDDPDDPADFPNVEGLFDMIQDAIDSMAMATTVEYEEQYGYPVEASETKEMLRHRVRALKSLEHMEEGA